MNAEYRQGYMDAMSDVIRKLTVRIDILEASEGDYADLINVLEGMEEDCQTMRNDMRQAVEEHE